jgi:formate-dependent nitrite reductase membrane component NrfD
MNEVRSYHGQPVIKEPIWTWEIPTYFFTGGLAGASAGLAYLAELRGNDQLARRAWVNAALAVSASPALLTSDLGRPRRFLNMLRLVKVTSPMSLGSWMLAAFGPLTAAATASAWTGAAPRAGAVAKAGSALFGLPICTYTAALIANTAVPVWHEARAMLPAVFAAGAAASAGAAAMAWTPPHQAAAARRLTVIGAAAELVAVTAMERRLGELGRPYDEGAAGVLGRLAKACTVAGGAIAASPAARTRVGAASGAALVTAGAVLERWSIFRAGAQSAADPAAVIVPQRRRLSAAR